MALNDENVLDEQETATEVDADSAIAGEGGEAETEGKDPAVEDEAEDEVVISIGDQVPAGEVEEDDNAPGLVNKLRRLTREKDLELRKLRAKLVTPVVVVEAPSAVPKPTLAGCEYDEEAYEAKLGEWHDQQAVVKAAEAKKADAHKAEQDAWNNQLANYAKAKAALKVARYDEFEDAVRNAFSTVQQSVLIDAAKNPAQVVAALGGNPARLKMMAAITSPAKFAYALSDLEKEMKVTPRKAVPPPESVVHSSAPILKGNDVLEKLRTEADRTGDRSKVTAYMRQQKNK